MAQMAVQRQRPLSMPVWLAVLLIILASGGGAYLLYHFLSAGKSTPDAVVVGQGRPYQPRTRADANTSFASRLGFGAPAEGITRRGTTSVTIRKGNTIARAYVDKSGWTISSFDYVFEVRQSWVTPDQWQLHRLAQRVVSESSLAQRLNVTPEQMQSLKSLNYETSLGAAEQKNICSLIAAWDKANTQTKEAAGLKVLEAVGAAGNQHLSAAKDAMIQRVKQIPTILTASQISQAKGG